MADRFMHPSSNPLQGRGPPPNMNKPHPGYGGSYWQHDGPAPHRNSFSDSGPRVHQHIPHPSGPSGPGSYSHPPVHHPGGYPPSEHVRPHMHHMQNQPNHSHHAPPPHQVYNSGHHGYNSFPSSARPAPMPSHPGQPGPAYQRSSGTPPIVMTSHPRPMYEHSRPDPMRGPPPPLPPHVQRYQSHMQSQPGHHMPPHMEAHRGQSPHLSHSRVMMQQQPPVHYATHSSQIPVYASDRKSPPMPHATVHHNQSQHVAQRNVPIAQPVPQTEYQHFKPQMTPASTESYSATPQEVDNNNSQPNASSVPANQDSTAASSSSTSSLSQNLAVAPPPRRASNKAKQRIQEQTAVINHELNRPSIPPSQPTVLFGDNVTRSTPDVEEVDEEALALELQEKQKWQKDLLERLDRMDKEFSENQEHLYEEKVKQYDTELLQILKGIHPDYIQVLSELEAERDAMIKEAELFRDYQLDCANRLYQTEYEACVSEYNAEKSGLRDKMLQELNEKKRKYREDLDSFDLSNDAVLDSQKPVRKTTRNSQPKPEEKRERKRAKAASNALLPFMLKEAEISEDFDIFRKHSVAIRNKSSIAVGKASRR